MLIRIYIIQQLPSSHKIHSQLMDNQHIEIPLQENMATEENTPNLKPQLFKDSHIIEYFIRRGIQGGELAELNRFRIYLKAT